MKDKKAMVVVVGASVVLIAAVITYARVNGAPSILELQDDEPVFAEMAGTGQETPGLEAAQGQGTCGSMNVGSFEGRVDYDKDEDYHFLQLRGARLPFKASPIDAQKVPLETPGTSVKEDNTALLYGILGPQVDYATILVNPEEEEEVMPAVLDLARYLRMVNPRKFSGLAYTKEGGKLERSTEIGPQIQSWKEATAKTPRILLKGPKSGAEKTRVVVSGEGQVLIEGKTFPELYMAADMVSLTMLKMLCGSPDCPDAAACATGGKCGCG